MKRDTWRAKVVETEVKQAKKQANRKHMIRKSKDYFEKMS